MSRTENNFVLESITTFKKKKDFSYVHVIYKLLVLQNKTEAAGCFCVLIQAHDDFLYFSSSGKKFINLLFCCVKGHVADINSG